MSLIINLFHTTIFDLKCVIVKKVLCTYDCSQETHVILRGEDRYRFFFF